MLRIAPSILSADFAKLGEEIRNVEQHGADWIHVDVMDGHFVPNLTIGVPVVEAIRPHTTLPLDVHLMISNPDSFIPLFAQAGADCITIHAEASAHLHRSIQLIKGTGKKAGVALNPATPIHVLEHVLHDVDLILIMTVNPGFGGQQFIASMAPKIKALRSMLNAQGLSGVHIEVDGGINDETARIVADAGADVLVAGSYIFNSTDRTGAITSLRGV